MAKKTKDERESLATFRRIVEYDKLIASGKYPSVADFQKKFEISEATVHRDLDALRYDFGADEFLEYDRLKKGYHYRNPTFRIPALLATEKQIIAAQQMANLLEMIKGTPVYSQAIEVFATFSDNLEQNSKINAKKLSNRIVFLGMSPVDIEDDVWEKLEQALGENRYITFDYEKRDKTYLVSMKPYQLIYYNGMWTLYGYRTDGEYKGLKFFNLPVIKNLKVRNTTFELPENFEYEKNAVGNFGRYIGDKTELYKIKILAKATWILDYAKTYNWANDQKFEKHEDGSSIMSFTSNQFYPILDWVLEKGQYVIPLEPKRLVDLWKENATQMAENAIKITENAKNEASAKKKQRSKTEELARSMLDSHSTKYFLID